MNIDNLLVRYIFDLTSLFFLFWSRDKKVADRFICRKGFMIYEVFQEERAVCGTEVRASVCVLQITDAHEKISEEYVEGGSVHEEGQEHSEYYVYRPDHEDQIRALFNKVSDLREIKLNSPLQVRAYMELKKLTYKCVPGLSEIES